VELGGKIYYVGGSEGSTSGPMGPTSSTVFVYDPATDSFSEGTPMPAGRERGGAGTATYNGKIYIAGGQHDPPDGVYNPRAKPWFDVYDPATKTWTQLPNMPRARDHFHAQVVDGKFYAIGGRQTRDTNIVTAVDVYDLSQGTTGTWQTLNTALPTPRSGFTTAVLGNEILVIGGEGGGIAHNAVEAYDTATNTWRTLEPMPTGRHGIQAVVHNGGVYVAAGANKQGASPTNVHEAFFLNGITTTTCKPPSPGDPTAPVVQAPTQNLNANFQLNSTVPVRINWSATDADGIASYELQQSTNGGAFTNVTLPSATAKSVTPKLGVGNTYAFRVRAKDNAGNLSDWKAGPTFKVNALQESNAAVTYNGAWSTQNITNASGGSLKFASAAGASASLTSISNALNVGWIAHKAADRGKAEVWLDGTLANTVDLYSSTLQLRKSVFVKNALNPAVAHTVEVRVLGTKNASSSGTRVDVDAFVVLEKVP
jgi:hypothetical protein